MRTSNSLLLTPNYTLFTMHSTWHTELFQSLLWVASHLQRFSIHSNTNVTNLTWHETFAGRYSDISISARQIHSWAKLQSIKKNISELICLSHKTKSEWGMFTWGKILTRHRSRWNKEISPLFCLQLHWYDCLTRDHIENMRGCFDTPL